MRGTAWALLLVVAWSLGPSWDQAAAQQPEETHPLIVRFASPEARASALQRFGAVPRGALRRLGFERIEARGQSAEALAAAMGRHPGVLAAEPDHPVRLSLVPNDPYFRTDPITGQGQWGLRTAQVDDAWDVQRGSAAITVAVIDTGIDAGHPDLAPAVVPGTRFLSRPDPSCDERSDERDDNGHGTHVAGIVAAAGNNGIGIAGAAFGVRVLSIKTLDCTGAGRSSDTAEAITYAADSGARVINMSLGSTSASKAVAAAVEYALQRGALIVAAAGNCGGAANDCPAANAVEYPAAYAGVLAVAATDSSDRRASFSTANSSVGIAAPGVRIVSTFPRYRVTLAAPSDPYVSMSGTSMAAPLVSGVAALLLSRQRSLRPEQVVAQLRATADDLGAEGWDAGFGDGRVNALRALTEPLGAVPVSTAPPTSTPTPNPSPTPSPAPTATPAPTPTVAPPPGASPLCVAGRAGAPTSVAFLPNVTKTLGGLDGWQTPFIVQNRGSVQTDLEVSYYRFSDGECMSRRTISALGPGRSSALSPNHDAALPNDTQLSVVVRSFGAPVVAVVNEHAGSGDRAQALSYGGFASGSSKVSLPNVVRRSFGFHTPFVIQNLGASSTTVTARFVPSDGSGPVVVTRTMASGRSAFIEPDVEPGLRDGMRYAVTLTAPAPIAAVVNAHNEAANVAYSVDGQSGGAPTLYVPYVVRDTAAGRVSTVVVQNLGVAPVAPVLSFVPLVGHPGAAQGLAAPPIPPGGSWAFDPRFTLETTIPCVGPSETCLADGEYGLVISSRSGDLAATVSVIGRTTAMGYAATSPSARAFLPNVTRTLGGPAGWTTELFVQSGTATGATLRWYRFADGALAHTQTVALGAGRSARIDPRQLAGLSDDAQYAVVVEGVGGTVTAIAAQTAAGGDNAMSYEGFPAD